jgi:hypothetical protein
MKKKKLEDKLSKTKKKLAKAKSRVAELESKLEAEEPSTPATTRKRVAKVSSAPITRESVKKAVADSMPKDGNHLDKTPTQS